VPEQSALNVAVPARVSSATSPFKLRVSVPVMLPDESWVNIPTAPTGPMAGIDPLIVNPHWPAALAAEHFLLSSAATLDGMLKAKITVSTTTEVIGETFDFILILLVFNVV
jgi:hypothetical protein